MAGLELRRTAEGERRHEARRAAADDGIPQCLVPGFHRVPPEAASAADCRGSGNRSCPAAPGPRAAQREPHSAAARASTPRVSIAPPNRKTLLNPKPHRRRLAPLPPAHRRAPAAPDGDHLREQPRRRAAGLRSRHQRRHGGRACARDHRASSVLGLLLATGTSLRLPLAHAEARPADRPAAERAELLPLCRRGAAAGRAGAADLQHLPDPAGGDLLAGGRPAPGPRTLIAMPVILVGLTLALNVARHRRRAVGPGAGTAAGSGGAIASRWSSMSAGVGFALAAATSFAVALYLTTRWLGGVEAGCAPC